MKISLRSILEEKLLKLTQDIAGAYTDYNRFKEIKLENPRFQTVQPTGDPAQPQIIKTVDDYIGETRKFIFATQNLINTTNNILDSDDEDIPIKNWLESLKSE